MITENVISLLQSVPKVNAYGEKITVVAAVKLQTPEAINEAIAAGITEIGDNHVQEFRDKYSLIVGNPRRHFIGHLQTNKVKYLIGKTDLYESVDRMELAEELSKRSKNAGVTSNILIQVNIGNEESKGGFELSCAKQAYADIKELPALHIQGFMAMLPLSDNEPYLIELVQKMRALYDEVRATDPAIQYLSMGMSGDWKLCVAHGSNLIRIGTTLFGPRN